MQPPKAVWHRADGSSKVCGCGCAVRRRKLARAWTLWMERTALRSVDCEGGDESEDEGAECSEEDEL